MAFSLVWISLSVWISLPWVRELETVTGTPLAWVTIALVAYPPGAIVAFMAFSLLLDRQPPLRVVSPTSALTVIIAARNEEDGMQGLYQSTLVAQGAFSLYLTAEVRRVGG